MREYEFTCILKSDLSEQDRKQLTDKYEALLYGNGGELIRKQDWGVKKLAYPIKKQFRGYYVNYSFASSDKVGLAECERLMRIDNDVLRYLLIKVSDSVDVESRKAILKEKEEKARKQVEATLASANEELSE